MGGGSDAVLSLLRASGEARLEGSSKRLLSTVTTDTTLTSVMLARLALYLLATCVAGAFAAWETVDEAGAPLDLDYERLLVLRLFVQPR